MTRVQLKCLYILLVTLQTDALLLENISFHSQTLVLVLMGGAGESEVKGKALLSKADGKSLGENDIS